MIAEIAPELALERWFASLERPVRYDLTSSGAPGLRLDDLLATATPAERGGFTCTPLGYGPADGSPALRATVAARYADAGTDQIIATCGAMEALHLAFAALVRPGDEVVVQDPMYPAAEGAAAMRGATVLRWPIDDGGSYRSDVDRLIPLLTRRTRLVAITQPNGPTGAVMDAGDLHALHHELDARGIWLLSDEVYRDLGLDARIDIPSAFGGERTVVLGDLSKPFGLGGLRIGWLAARSRDLLQRVRRIRDHTTLSLPTVSDALGRIALAHRDELLAGPLANARANLAALRSLASRHEGLSLPLPRGGVTAFMRVAGAADVQRELRRLGVLVVPGAFFGRRDHLRIGLAGAPRDFAEALAHLDRILVRRAAVQDRGRRP